MKSYLFLLIVFFLIAFDVKSQNNSTETLPKAQNSVQSSELKEAKQINAQVIRLYQAGKFDEALPLAERALILREKVLGTEHQLVVVALRNLAEVQLAKKKNEEAEATYDRYLNVYGKVLGENNADFIGALDRYVCLLVGINRRGKALEVQKRLYKLDNKFDYEEAAKTSAKNLEMAGLASGKIVNLPRPAYLAEARQAGISGSVIFKITVDETGKVVAVKVLCGHPLLVKGAETSIWQAQYKPTVVSGQPVKILGIAIYNFTEK